MLIKYQKSIVNITITDRNASRSTHITFQKKNQDVNELGRFLRENQMQRRKNVFWWQETTLCVCVLALVWVCCAFVEFCMTCLRDR